MLPDGLLLGMLLFLVLWFFVFAGLWQMDVKGPISCYVCCSFIAVRWGR